MLKYLLNLFPDSNARRHDTVRYDTVAYISPAKWYSTPFNLVGPMHIIYINKQYCQQLINGQWNQIYWLDFGMHEIKCVHLFTNTMDNNYDVESM